MSRPFFKLPNVRGHAEDFRRYYPQCIQRDKRDSGIDKLSPCHGGSLRRGHFFKTSRAQCTRNKKIERATMQDVSDVPVPAAVAQDGENRQPGDT